MEAPDSSDAFAALTSLNQHRQDGRRSPHKPLLVLLALSEFAAKGTSAMPWSTAEQRLADLIKDFGPPTKTGRAQSAAYPFTRLRSDGVWVLDQDVPMDFVRPLQSGDVVGQFSSSIEQALRLDASLLRRVASSLVKAEFPTSVAADVLLAVGLDPELAFASPPSPLRSEVRRRSGAWPRDVLAAWDRQCAFCGFDGQLAETPIGIEAAHVRWFNFGGPDSLDNGLALCALHHRLFDRGAVGLDANYRIQVSEHFSARTDQGKRVYELHERPLRPRPGTAVPAESHVNWHNAEVFKGRTLVA